MAGEIMAFSCRHEWDCGISLQKCHGGFCTITCNPTWDLGWCPDEFTACVPETQHGTINDTHYCMMRYGRASF
mgnify:FL=1